MINLRLPQEDRLYLNDRGTFSVDVAVDGSPSGIEELTGKILAYNEHVIVESSRLLGTNVLCISGLSIDVKSVLHWLADNRN